MKTIILILLILAALFAAYLLFRPTDISNYTCPQVEYIDCMPSISAEVAPMCNGPYHDWIKTNCTTVEFVY